MGIFPKLQLPNPHVATGKLCLRRHVPVHTLARNAVIQSRIWRLFVGFEAEELVTSPSHAVHMDAGIAVLRLLDSFGDALVVASFKGYSAVRSYRHAHVVRGLLASAVLHMDYHPCCIGSSGVVAGAALASS